jgi:glutathione synthase/RimK-type ligase-like ATP-grasp enzyme
LILLIGEGPDETMSQYLLERLQEMDAEVRWVDQNTIPVENHLTQYVKDGKLHGELIIDGEAIDLAKFKGIYTRMKSFEHELSLASGYDDFLQAERYVALNLWLQHSPGMVINTPKSQITNGSKPYQSWIIQQYGFKIPRSIITNNPVRAREFIEQHDRQVIFKSVSAERSEVCMVSDESMENLESLTHCPTLFQERVPGIDLRVHTLATGEVLASEIRSESSDYRYDKERSIVPTEIPENIREICVNITRDLGLYLSGIDVRRTPDGDYYCFEVNPSPAFTWYENQTGQPISQAVANMLVNADQVLEQKIVNRKY